MPCKAVIRKSARTPQETVASESTHTIKKKTVLVFWKLMIRQEIVWDLLFQDIMRITSLEKGTIQ